MERVLPKMFFTKSVKIDSREPFVSRLYHSFCFTGRKVRNYCPAMDEMVHSCQLALRYNNLGNSHNLQCMNRIRIVFPIIFE